MPSTIAVPRRGCAPPVLIQFFGISAAPKREFHLASRRWAQIETTSPAVGRIGRSFPCEPPSASASQLRVDRRPRAPGQRGDRQCGRLGTGLRRSFAGRAEIASDCEIRRPEREAMITVVVITTVVAGVQGLPVCGAGFRGPIFRGQSRTRRGAPVHARGCRQTDASTRHVTEGFIPPIRGGDVGPRNRQRGILPPGNLLVERHPRNQIRHYARRAATSGFRSGAGEARPAPSWRAAGVG